ncbi:hypothetical protein BY996DRAFT_6417678 [Phakopsora pachyrhizi]|uniref:Uncharacterized protein n=1 Tax=Phakopsora pachyrhizi TaxID=170000 RepID=A0AAV0BBK3_PHAPC|nr:hypothetical protein BY996DRAFT_6417678 [Phakopsora pachyrhizi]CAH7683683.1 hypothetical protein PPACK8108_LOCUS17338 [Phakopsora pachyrhizi]
MEIGQRLFLVEIEEASVATATKSGSNDTEEGLGILFFSSNNNYSGQSTILDGPTDSNNKTVSIPQTEGALIPEKPLSSASLTLEILKNSKAQDETPLGTVLDGNNESAARDGAARVGSMVIGDGRLSTNLSELEAPTDLTKL